VYDKARNELSDRVNGRAITRVARMSPWAWLVSCSKGISMWMYLGSADMVFMYIQESVCPTRYQCWLVSEMISERSHLYMNLMSHTLKEFETLKILSIWLSLVQVGDDRERRSIHVHVESIEAPLCCCCADRLWWREGCCQDDHEEEMIVND
jgi:hypothetical protein